MIVDAVKSADRSEFDAKVNARMFALEFGALLDGLSIQVALDDPEIDAVAADLEAQYVAALRAAEQVADVLEVGVPFSDPLADGPTIQRSTFEALRQGMTLAGTLALIERARLAKPVVVFSYLNPILRYGLDRFLHGCGGSQIVVQELGCAAWKEPLGLKLSGLLQKTRERTLRCISVHVGELNGTARHGQNLCDTASHVASADHGDR